MMDYWPKLAREAFDKLYQETYDDCEYEDNTLKLEILGRVKVSALDLKTTILIAEMAFNRGFAEGDYGCCLSSEKEIRAKDFWYCFFKSLLVPAAKHNSRQEEIKTEALKTYKKTLSGTIKRIDEIIRLFGDIEHYRQEYGIDCANLVTQCPLDWLIGGMEKVDDFFTYKESPSFHPAYDELCLLRSRYINGQYWPNGIAVMESLKQQVEENLAHIKNQQRDTRMRGFLTELVEWGWNRPKNQCCFVLPANFSENFKESSMLSLISALLDVKKKKNDENEDEEIIPKSNFHNLASASGFRDKKSSFSNEKNSKTGRTKNKSVQN